MSILGNWIKSWLGPRVHGTHSSVRLRVEILEDRCVPATGLTANQEFVSQTYVDLLHRDIDPSGLSYWSSQLDHGKSKASVVLGIESSHEYRLSQVQSIYQQFLQRSVDAGSQEFWVKELSKHSVEQTKAGIAGSAEFFQIAGQTNDGFLSTLYQNVLGRDIDPTGQAYYSQQLAAGASRTAVAQQILSSIEYREHLVGNLYSQFLHRTPDAGGLSSWHQNLNNGMTEQQVIANMISLAEYSIRTPTTPTVTDPATAKSLNATTVTISGSAEAGSNVQVYSDVNQNGIVDGGDQVVGSQQLTGDSATFAITVSLTPNASNLFLATATNSFGKQSTAAIVPAITEDSVVPEVTAPGNQSSNEGATISGLAVKATDANNTPLMTYSASKLPVGLSIDSSTGVISGKIGSGASSSSPYTVTVSASDGVNTGNATFTWVVAHVLTPTISTTASNPTKLATIPYTVNFSDGVTGFSQSKLTVTNGTVSNFVAASATTYTFNVTPTADGTINVSIPAGAGTDAGGTGSVAASTSIVSLRTDSGMTNSLPDVTSPNFVASGTQGLKIWNVQPGIVGPTVQPNSTISVFYTGWLTDGTVFEQSRTAGSPATFSLAGLIAGWQQGLVGRQAGTIVRLYIPSDLGYGANGSPPKIPANADLVFEIKIIAVT